MYYLPEPQRRLHDYKLEGDLRDAYVELLSAQCAIDRVKTRYSPEEVAHCSSKFIVSRSISAAVAIHEFFTSVHNYMLRNEPPPQAAEPTGSDKAI